MTAAIDVLSRTVSVPQNRRVLNTAAEFSAQVTKSLLIAAGHLRQSPQLRDTARSVVALLLSGWRHDAQEQLEPDLPMLRDLTALEEHQEREVACGIAVLWDEFVGQLGGPAGYAGKSEAQRADYVGTLKQAAERVRSNAGAERQHFALAPNLMASYAELLVKEQPSAHERALAGRVAQLATRGHLIRKAGRKL